MQNLKKLIIKLQKKNTQVRKKKSRLKKPKKYFGFRKFLKFIKLWPNLIRNIPIFYRNKFILKKIKSVNLQRKVVKFIVPLPSKLWYNDFNLNTTKPITRNMWNFKVNYINPHPHFFRYKPFFLAKKLNLVGSYMSYYNNSRKVQKYWKFHELLSIKAGNSDILGKALVLKKKTLKIRLSKKSHLPQHKLFFLVNSFLAKNTKFKISLRGIRRPRILLKSDFSRPYLFLNSAFKKSLKTKVIKLALKFLKKPTSKNFKRWYIKKSRRLLKRFFKNRRFKIRKRRRRRLKRPSVLLLKKLKTQVYSSSSSNKRLSYRNLFNTPNQLIFLSKFKSKRLRRYSRKKRRISSKHVLLLRYSTYWYMKRLAPKRRVRGFLKRSRKRHKRLWLRLKRCKFQRSLKWRRRKLYRKWARKALIFIKNRRRKKKRSVIKRQFKLLKFLPNNSPLNRFLFIDKLYFDKVLEEKHSLGLFGYKCRKLFKKTITNLGCFKTSGNPWLQSKSKKNFIFKNFGVFLGHKLAYFSNKIFKYKFSFKKILFSFLFLNQVKKNLMNKKRRILISRFFSKFKTFSPKSSRFSIKLLKKKFKNYYNFNLLNKSFRNKIISSLDFFSADLSKLSSAVYTKPFGEVLYPLNYKHRGEDTSVKLKEVHIKRIRFKPGYQRIWRNARMAVKESLGVRFRYQHRLTRYLGRFFYSTKHHFFGHGEMSVLSIIMYSRLLPDVNAFNSFRSLGLIYLNGEFIQTSDQLVVRLDILQLIVSQWYYIIYRWLANWTLLRTRKFKRLVYRKGLASKYKLMKTRKQKSQYTPLWIHNIRYDISDVKPYLEVDYFTLSVFILYDPLFLSYITPNDFPDSRQNTYRLYNWKYIN